MLKDIIKKKYLFYLNKIQHTHSYNNSCHGYGERDNNVRVHCLECACGSRKTIFCNKKYIEKDVLEIIKLWENNLITTETLRETIK